MRRRRASTLAESLVAAAILAAIGGLLIVALAQATQAGQRALLGAQARRLLQQELEQARSGRGIPSSGTVGPFTVAVTSWTPGANVLGGTPVWTPDCYGGSPCSNSLSTSMSGVSDVSITITYTADGTMVAGGHTSTPP